MTTQNIKTEHSAGGVVYKWEHNQILWLVGKHSGYHKWVLPKGLIEPGETEKDTTLREVAEEMGITAKIIGDQPIHTEKYSYTATFKPSPDDSNRRVAQYQESIKGDTLVHKTVDFFLMQWVSGDPKDHDWEMTDAGWFSFKEASQKLAFEGERLALQIARDTISKALS